METPLCAPLPEITPVPLADLTALGGEQADYAFDCNGVRFVSIGGDLLRFPVPGTPAAAKATRSIIRTVMQQERAAVQEAA